MSAVREIAHRLDPVVWVKEVLGVEPTAWQETFLRAQRGASILLTARQVGKTTTAAWAIAHTAVFQPGSLSVIACPSHDQGAAALRRVRECVTKAGARLAIDNVRSLELENGSRVQALHDNGDAVRGLTVNGWIVADEAAWLSDDLIAALRPMRARCPQARFVMLSTARTRSDPFWTRWTGDDQSWIRLKATADDGVLPASFLAQERQAMTEAEFKREYLCIPEGGEANPFIPDLYQRATQIRVAAARGAPATNFNPDDPRTWGYFKPYFIAHDLGQTRDRSTAVVGGLGPFEPSRIGIAECIELPQGLTGHARADALAAIDYCHHQMALIIVDMSNDASYGELLYERFGPRVIGLHITRHGNGQTAVPHPIKGGAIPVYPIGRTALIESYLMLLQQRLVRIVDGEMAQRAYNQLAALEVEIRDTGTLYTCLAGRQDDLGISCAMLAWAAQHPHLPHWFATFERSRTTRKLAPAPSPLGWT